MPRDIQTQLTKILTDCLGVDPSRVTDDAQIRLDLCADSLDMIEIIMSIEEEFGIEIPDDDAEAVTTVADCIALIRRLLTAHAEAGNA